MKQLLIDLFVGFVCLFLCFFQGAAEGGMIELAAVGLPPPEQGNSVIFDYLSSVFLSFSLKDSFKPNILKSIPIKINSKIYHAQLYLW